MAPGARTATGLAASYEVLDWTGRISSAVGQISHIPDSLTRPGLCSSQFRIWSSEIELHD